MRYKITVWIRSTNFATFTVTESKLIEFIDFIESKDYLELKNIEDAEHGNIWAIRRQGWRVVQTILRNDKGIRCI